MSHFAKNSQDREAKKMIETGYRGGLVSRVKNQQSGKKYMISTAQEIEKDYWSIVIMNIKFFGLWVDIYHPLYTFIRNNKEDAHSIHTTLKKIVETIPEKGWLELFPDPSPPEGYSGDAKRILGQC